MDQKESTRAGNGLVNSNQPTHGSAGTCSQCGHRDPEAGGRSSGGDNRRSTLRDRGRKDADHEFFQMTLISQIMTHKKQKQLIEMQAEADKLFQECRQTGKPFFEWHGWICDYIETQLSKYDEFK